MHYVQRTTYCTGGPLNSTLAGPDDAILCKTSLFACPICTQKSPAPYLGPQSKPDTYPLKLLTLGLCPAKMMAPRVCAQYCAGCSTLACDYTPNP